MCGRIQDRTMICSTSRLPSLMSAFARLGSHSPLTYWPTVSLPGTT
jgi:hypothetical protein